MSGMVPENPWTFTGPRTTEQGFRPYGTMLDPFLRNMPHTDLGDYGEPMEGFEGSGTNADRLVDHDFFNKFEDDCDDRDMAIQEKPPTMQQ